jgi:hypothetical protein
MPIMSIRRKLTRSVCRVGERLRGASAAAGWECAANMASHMARLHTRTRNSGTRLRETASKSSRGNQSSGRWSIFAPPDAYRYYHATRADLLRRLDRPEEARAAYERALELLIPSQSGGFWCKVRIVR